MAFDLVTAAWLPVVRGSGSRGWVAPGDLASDLNEDPILRLDFPRADWNAAVTEWLIGIVWLAFGPQADAAWAELFMRPKPPGLPARLASLAGAFELQGEGPLAFQDYEALDTPTLPLSGLLMDAPGENTVRKNADLFVKRGAPQVLCLPFAAAALITLQTYAPSGGAGHRTSLRGGGPLTSLLRPYLRSEGAAGGAQSLWRTLWANLPDADFERTRPGLDDCLPWRRPTRTSDGGAVVRPEDAAPALAFFACPRRIRLVFGQGHCDWSGAEGPVALGFQTRNRGASYRGWRHPLSPYRTDAAGQLTAAHPRAETFDLSSFPAWWGLDGVPARALPAWPRRRARLPRADWTVELEVFGFDMDNMKARQWLTRRLPWLPLDGEDAAETRAFVREGVEALESAVRSLVHGARVAQFGLETAGGYELPAGLPSEALRDLAAPLRHAVEAAFLALVGRLIDAPAAGARGAAARAWLDTLREAARQRLDSALDTDAAARVNPRRLVAVRKLLAAALGERGAVARSLQAAMAA